MTPIEELRQATHSLHERLDSHPYAARVMAGTVSLSEYAAFLRALAVVHEVVQRAREASSDPLVRALVSGDEEPLPALSRDLDHLTSLGVQAEPVSPAAVNLAESIQNLSNGSPKALPGVLYVLEGSKLGGLVQSAALAKVKGLESAGRDYLSGAGAGTRPRFRGFIDRLNAVLADDARPAVAGAIATFEGFQRILESIAPRA